jgi:hypothetical protein
MELVIFSIVRHLLTLVAGSLLTIGISEADTQNLAQAATPVVSGAVLYGVSQVLSLKNAKKR